MARSKAHADIYYDASGLGGESSALCWKLEEHPGDDDRRLLARKLTSGTLGTGKGPELPPNWGRYQLLGECRPGGGDTDGPSGRELWPHRQNGGVEDLRDFGQEPSEGLSVSDVTPGLLDTIGASITMDMPVVEAAAAFAEERDLEIGEEELNKLLDVPVIEEAESADEADEEPGGEGPSGEEGNTISDDKFYMDIPGNRRRYPVGSAQTEAGRCGCP